MTVAYVGLGANLGDPAATIDAAVAAIATIPGVAVNGVSALRMTDPVGYLDQPPFLNGALRLETSLDARSLLDVLLEVERRLGRVRRGPRFGPRAIDLDLLLHGAEVVRRPDLEVPHPRLHERAFALEPLLDLDPDLEVPGRGRVADLLAAVDAEPARVVRDALPHPRPVDSRERRH